jgi:DNA-directed RNA polymerase subunit M/transcription elongation factor TFIIS
MNLFDPAGQEFLRISERYRQMSDEELLVLIPQSSELTPFAQQALANEVRQRGLKAEADEKPSPTPFKPQPDFFGQKSEHEFPKFYNSLGEESANLDSSDEPNFSDDSDSSYEEDRKLVDLCTVYSVRDALQVQGLLDGAGIPFFMGPEKATGVDKVTSNFANGVSVQIMRIGLPWTHQPMQHFEPEDDPDAKKEDEDLDEVSIRCPKCHSTEVVFEGGTSTPIVASNDSSQKFKWTCDSCGHQWEDDGVAKGE